MINPEVFVAKTIDACQEIFDMMLPLQMVANGSNRPVAVQDSLGEFNEDIIASIGLTGIHSGTISLYISQDLSLKIAGWLMDEAYTEANTEVFESVGELINLIAGGLKNRLSTDQEDVYDMSSPIVISGQDKYIYHSKRLEHMIATIETDQGTFYVVLALERS